jgi:hypothetical protein
MNRRTFSIATTTSLVFANASASAQPQGVRIRFVITRVTKSSDGAHARSTYENAVLMAPNERFQADFQDEYRLALRPVQTGEGIRIEASLTDLRLNPATQMSGQAFLDIGQGGSITFQSPGNETYGLGLLLTSQPLPKSAA